MIWAAGDSMCRGFLVGGTAGRTTLNGEGLQHQDGHSHVLAALIRAPLASIKRALKIKLDAGNEKFSAQLVCLIVLNSFKADRLRR